MPAGGEDGHPVGKPACLAIRFHGGGIIPEEPLDILDFGPQQNFQVGMPLDLLLQPAEIGLHLLALPRFSDLQSRSAELSALFNEVGLESLLGEVQGGIHAGKASADHRCGVNDFQLHGFYGRRKAGF